MEMGSSSEPNSDSLNGLTFGKKIYFEDSTTSTASTTSNKIVAPPKKAKSLASSSSNINSNQQQISIPRCQVEGCKVDLTGAKAYYCRHKVCGIHSKSPKVVVAGIEQRFCQQCSRFHQLHEFDQGKRSCRRRLAGHNERRRKPPPVPSRYGRMSSSFYEDSTRFRGFLMDFSYPRPLQPPAGDLWPRISNIHQYQANPNTASNIPPAAQPYIHAMNHYSSELPPHEYISGVSDSSCALSLLSTQPPWGSNAPSIPGNRPPHSCSTIDGMPMGPPMAHNSCLLHPYGFKNHHETQHDVCLGQIHDGGDVNGQFSGELELALQGNRNHPDHGSGGGYDHSAHGMNWSL